MVHDCAALQQRRATLDEWRGLLCTLLLCHQLCNQDAITGIVIPCLQFQSDMLCCPLVRCTATTPCMPMDSSSSKTTSACADAPVNKSIPMPLRERVE